MGADTKQNRLATFVRCLCLACILLAFALLAFGYYAPLLAARDVFRPTLIVFIPTGIRRILIGLAVVGVLALIANMRAKALGASLLVCSLGCLVGYHLLLTSEKETSMFLHEVSKRINSDIGANTLTGLFADLQNEVQDGKRVGSPVRTHEFPPVIQRLFRTVPPQGNLNFIDKNVFDLEIRWGGPLFNWGVQVFGDTPEEGLQSKKIHTQKLYTNAFVFIGK